MRPFDVILFDIGGVLLTNGWDREERAAVLAQFKLDADEFEALHRAAYPAWERGAATVAQYLDQTVFHLPRTFSLDEFFAAICAGSRPLPNGALGLLDELAATNQYLLGALNNEARETNAYRFDHFGLRKIFKVVLSSCYLGLRKPDAPFFQRALDILAAPAERILFIDDRPENVLAATAAGMRAIHFIGAEALRQELQSLGVL